MNLASTKNIPPGFDNHVFDSQNTFRLIMEAMARPGKKMNMELNTDPPKNMYKTTAAAVLALFDPDTPYYLGTNDSQLERWIKFHCGSKISENKKDSVFALFLHNEQIDLNSFSKGSFIRPDLSATFIIQVDEITELHSNKSLVLKGPGIKDTHNVFLKGFNKDILKGRSDCFFPMGQDFIFTDPSGFLCIPRTTVIEGL